MSVKLAPDVKLLAAVGRNCCALGREKPRWSIFHFKLPRTCEQDLLKSPQDLAGETVARQEQVSTRSKEQLTKRWGFVISEWVEVTTLV